MRRTLLKAISQAGGILPAAKKSGVHPSQLRRFASGDRDPSFRTVERLVKTLGLELRPREPKRQLEGE